MSFLKYFDAVFAISTNTRRDIIKFTNCPQKKIIVSYLSIENFFNSKKVNKVNICKKYNIPFEKKKILVHLSRGKTNQNYFIKNPEIVFKTINLLLKKNKNLIFINLGGKIDFSENKNLKKHFHILPFLKRQDLQEIYKICDILFFPSIYEGFGLPLLESMKCGLPIVSSDNSSIPEIVGNSAILHKKNDHVSFANSIENLLKNRSLRNKLIKNGFKQSKKFDPNKIYKFV